MCSIERYSDGGNEITLENLRSFDFERVLSRQSDDAEKIEERTCQRYSASFIEAAKVAADEGDQKQEEICALFATLTSLRFYFNHDPILRFPSPEFGEENLDILRQFACEIEDPELRARTADILWTLGVGKGFQFAELAVDSYIEVAAGFDRLEAAQRRTERMERALQISAALDPKGQKFASTIAFIDAELKDMKVADILHGPAHLLRLLRKHKQGDPAVYIPYATDLANEYEKKKSWEGARAVWYIARDWHRLALNDEGIRCACDDLRTGSPRLDEEGYQYTLQSGRSSSTRINSSATQWGVFR